MNALEGLFTVDFEGQFALQKRGKLGTQSQKKTQPSFNGCASLSF
jgi:hypothetical protein